MIRIASSLTNRIFIASTLLAIVSLGLAFSFVNARVSSEAEADLRRSLTEAATLVDLRRENLTETFRTMATLVADIPKLKAAMSTPADARTAEELEMAKSTVQRLADEYRTLIAADLLLLVPKDLFISFIWFLAFAGDTVTWSGRRFRVFKSGRMVDVTIDADTALQRWPAAPVSDSHQE